MSCSHGDLSLCVPASLPEAVLVKALNEGESTVGELVKGRCGSLTARGDEHSVRLHNLANTVIGRGHGR